MLILILMDHSHLNVTIRRAAPGDARHGPEPHRGRAPQPRDGGEH